MKPCIIKPIGQLTESSGPSGVSLEQLLYGWAFLRVDMNTARVLWITPLLP
jgi:hypothetical protein